MQDLIVSLSKNTVKVSTVGKEGLSYQKTELGNDIAADFLVKDVPRFSEELGNLISKVTPASPKNLSLTFLAGPEKTHFKFVTVAKGTEDVEAKVLAEAQEKLEGVSLESLYFGYEKIAPFVYQFIGVDKEFLETFIEVSNVVGISLKAVVPWVLLLPKYAEVNNPAIFIANYNNEQVVVLSELNGVFFTEVFEREQKPKELEKLVQQLSIYKRSNPINKIYTLNYENLFMDSGYEVENLQVPNEEMFEESGYELNVLANYMMDTHKELFLRQLNLLNLLPVPVEVEKKSKALVYVGSVLAVVLVVGGILLVKSRGNKSGEDMLAGNGSEATDVLSENVETQEPTEDTHAEQTGQTQEVEEQLSREDLSIRVENGAGISGVAGRTRDRLEEFGYVIGDNIGNADEVGNSETVLRFKKDKVKYQDLLKEDMKEVYLDIVVEDTLDDSAEYDLLITVGTNIEE
ncbi:LytR C-terminal domain-containing protein [Patescibacteria group bacterium]|nr:LytR C-terminal domain-containing protein [Patescibacteria group bacterium]